MKLHIFGTSRSTMNMATVTVNVQNQDEGPECDPRAKLFELEKTYYSGNKERWL